MTLKESKDISKGTLIRTNKTFLEENGIKTGIGIVNEYDDIGNLEILFICYTFNYSKQKFNPKILENYKDRFWRLFSSISKRMPKRVEEFILNTFYVGFALKNSPIISYVAPKFKEVGYKDFNIISIDYAVKKELNKWYNDSSLPSYNKIRKCKKKYKYLINRILKKPEDFIALEL